MRKAIIIVLLNLIAVTIALGQDMKITTPKKYSVYYVDKGKLKINWIIKKFAMKEKEWRISIADAILDKDERLLDAEKIKWKVSYDNKKISGDTNGVFTLTAGWDSLTTINKEQFAYIMIQQVGDTTSNVELKSELFTIYWGTRNKYERNNIDWNEARYYESVYEINKLEITKYETDEIDNLDNEDLSGDERRSRINEIKKRVKLKNEENESANFKLWKEYQYNFRNEQTINLLPVRTKIDATIFFEDEANTKAVNFLRNNSLSLSNEDKASLFSELATGYLGPVKLSLSALVTNSNGVVKDTAGNEIVDTVEQVKSSVQRVIAGGGNFNMFGAYPLVVVKLGILRSQGFVYANGSIDAPKIGTIEKFVLSGRVGLSLNAQIDLGIKDVAFILDGKINLIGGTDDYKKQLNLNESVIWYFPYTFALKIYNFQLALTITRGSNYVIDNFPKRVFSFSIQP